MKTRSFVLILIVMAVLLATWRFWPRGGQAGARVITTSAVTPAGATNSVVLEDKGKLSATTTNRLTFRLSNTPKANTLQGYAELTHAPHAVLLENAAMDTDLKLDLSIPKHLRAAGDPGSYIVQARGVVNPAFRALLTAAGAREISYIPNNALLVRLSAGAAGSLSGNPLVQAVLPFEPYYKVQASLLGQAVAETPLHIGQVLTLGLFPDTADQTMAAIEKMGGVLVSQDRSPFGPIVRVYPPQDWVALAQLPGVMRVEPTHRRVAANDLTRAIMGEATNSVTTNNYLNLSGRNVLVEVNDTGIDVNHPDFTGRVFGDSAGSLLDTDGHGTHVAGIIAGDGTKSLTVTNARGSIMPGTNFQFRGKAPAANLFSVGFLGNDTNFVVSDESLQEAPALTNALISNNSWVNDGVEEYDLSAASYDAAVRDALASRTGPQPVLFVFAAGNGGGGSSDGGNSLAGNADSINSPGTAKDVVTVGALEQYRYITNNVVALNGTTNAIWAPETDSSSQVADYSARGNVGIQTEGPYGRFKPDVIAPGTFVVSTRSTTWDTNAYYNVTNFNTQTYPGLVVQTNGLNYGGYGILAIPQNAIGVTITITPNADSPVPFPNFPIYVSATGVPTTTSYDILQTNAVNIPPNTGGVIASILSITNKQIQFAIGDGTNIPASFDLTTQVITTNDLGNQLAVLEFLNDFLCTAPQYYRYETGTSMAAPAVSGTLALMQDFFTNTLHTTPSPVLLKALLINGARSVPGYYYALTNAINLQGWGLPKISNSIPVALTNTAATTTAPLFFVDQSPTNTLTTGDRRTYLVTVPSIQARGQMLRVTLAWTDPPGNPAAAIKLVNNLNLVVTNLANGKVYYGNNFLPSSSPPSSATGSSNTIPDNINNVQNVYLSPTLGSNYAISVIGTAVNVNAVTTEQTNIVQDFALVVSCGDGNNTNGITFTAAAPSLVPTLTPLVSFLPATNGILFNQTAGSSSPWLSTNNLFLAGANGFVTNAALAIGQTNQWHFYVITNTFAATNANFTNAAFITFLPATLAIPREGGYVTTTQNPTRPEADVELFVSSTMNVPLGGDPLASQLTNIYSVVISNCLFGVNGDGASTGRGGTEYVVYNNSQANQVYYVGVQCDDQTAAEYAFVSIFSDTPFYSTNSDGSQDVYGKLVPANIPDGSNVHPGTSFCIGLALQPMQVRRITETNVITHQNFGDLAGFISHNSQYSLLNNHDAFGPVSQTNLVYDDSGEGPTNGLRHTDAPGTLKNFNLLPATGVWVLNEVDDANTQTGRVDNFTLRIYPHINNTGGFNTVTIPPKSWYFDFVQVPVGYTNLLVIATNLPPTSVPPIGLYLNYNTQPTFTSYLEMTNLINPGLLGPWGSLSYGPPLPPGVYWIGLYNPDTISHDVSYGIFLSGAGAETKVDYYSSGPVPLLDDAVTYDSIQVTNTLAIQDFNVGLRISHPRISDLAITLISPDGSRYLLMENRGAQSTNGCGATTVTTNFVNFNAQGGPAAQTNVVNTFATAGSIPINYNMYAVPDEMTVYYGPSNTLTAANLITNFFVSYAGQLIVTYPPPTATITSTYLTIVMNATNHPPATKWTYSVGGVVTNNYYLAFTENTNLTTTPIKFAPLPFTPYVTPGILWTDSFEAYPLGTYPFPSSIGGNWSVLANSVTITTNPPAYDGTNFLALNSGAVSTTLPTLTGQKYLLQYAQGTQPFDGLFVANNIGGTIATFPLVGGSAIFSSGFLGNPYALALDNSANLYVTDVSDNSIYEFTQGRVETTFASGASFSDLQYPDGLAFNNSGNLFVVNAGSLISGQDSIIYFSPAGVETYFTASTNLNAPSALAFDSNGNLYVANFYANNIIKFTPPFAAPNTNGTVFANTGLNPDALVIDASNNLYVANSGSGTIQKITPGGVVSTFNNTMNGPSALAFDDQGHLYSANYNDSTIYQFTPPSGVGTLFANTNLNNPFGMVFYDANLDATNSASWQLQSQTFTATQTATPLVLDASGGGYAGSGLLTNDFGNNQLFDDFTLTQVPTDLFYQAEQSLSAINTTSAFGKWQLEVLDNRAGATNPAPVLLSWRLEFIFANTNVPLSVLAGFVGQTNQIPAGSIYWYQVPVPASANFATNILIFADLPVNLWFSTNYPPTITNTADFLLLANSTNGIGLNSTNGPMLSTSTTPTIAPNTIYYLGVQNTNAIAVNAGVVVDFDHGNPTGSGGPASLHFSSAKYTGGHVSLKWPVSSGVQYAVQWKNTLTGTWNTITPTTTTTNGVSTFTDNGSQTAPLGATRFYRLVQLPPTGFNRVHY